MELNERSRWVIAAAIAALLAAAILPPRNIAEYSGTSLVGIAWPYYGLPRYRQTYNDDIINTASNLRAAIAAHEMAIELIAASHAATAVHTAGGVTVVGDGLLSRDSLARWGDAIDRELDLLPRAGAGGTPLVVGIYTRNARSGRPLTRAVGMDGSTPVCAVRVELGALLSRMTPIRNDSAGHVLHSRLLDWCALYARYGVPGQQVQRWTGFSSAPGEWVGMDQLDVYLDNAHQNGRSYASASYNAFGAACVRSGGMACLRAANLAGSVRTQWSDGSRAARWLVADLAVHRPAQFAAFWRSPDAPVAAFTAAFGEDASAVVREAATRVLVLPEGHPGVSVLVSSLGWVALLVAAGVAASARWEGRAART